MQPKQVVVAYDFTEDANAALDRAVELAGWNPKLVLHVVTAIRHGQSYDQAEHARLALLEHVERIVSETHPGAGIQVFAHARIGGPDDEILGLAEDVGADLIVIGSHDRGPVGRAIHGSVSEAVVHRARCPVMLARRKGYEDVTLERITEVTEHARRRPRPHRYSYESGIAQVRSDDWPIS